MKNNVTIKLGIKIIPLCVFGLLVINSIKAQYTSFPKSMAVWRNYEPPMVFRIANSEQTAGFSKQETDYLHWFVQIGQDTTIGGSTYKKLLQKIAITNLKFDSTYYGAYREDIVNKKVWFIGKDWKAEKLLYDFNLKIGDTIRGWYSIDSLPQTTYYVVTNIKTMKYQPNSNLTRNVISLWCENAPSTYMGGAFSIYEGIGISTGFLKGGVRKNLRSERQLCFTDYINEIQNCDKSPQPMAVEVAQLLTKIQLFPNPAQELLSIESAIPLSKLVVYRYNGLKVLESKATENLDVSALPEGLYLLEAWDMEGRRVLKKFEKR